MSSFDDIALSYRGPAFSTFYHGTIKREESEKRLADFSQKNQATTKNSGLYLVRKSDKMANAYVLSFMGKDSAISHFVITQTRNKKLNLGGLLFNSLHEVIAFYSFPQAGLLKNQWLVHSVAPPPPQHQMSLNQLAQLNRTSERPKVRSREFGNFGLPVSRE